MADHISLHVPVPEQILGHQRAVLVPAVWDSSFPCLHLAERKNLSIKRKYKALCSIGSAAGFLEVRKWGPIVCQKATLQEDLENANSPSWASVHPPVPCSHESYFMLCLSHKWGNEAGALPTVFGPQLQARAQLSLLSVSLE